MYTYVSNINTVPGPGIKSYAEAKDETGSLGTKPAVIFARYLCEVPEQKSTGTLLTSILVADLVFMQLLWKTFTFVLTAISVRKKPDGKPECGHIGFTKELK